MKRRFGPWMLPVLCQLARMKGLRGTAFDLFGRTAERREERRSIEEYVALVDEFCASLDAQRLPAAQQLAVLPAGIRGFGHVKARRLAALAKKKARLLADYRTRGAMRATA